MSRWLVSAGVVLLIGCNAILGNVAPNGDDDAGSGGAESTGGGGPGGLGGEAGSGTGGEDGSGGTSTGGLDGSGGSGSGGDGSGGTGPEPSVIGSVGEPCAPEGSYGCAGYNQREQLECEGGKWKNFDQCSSSERCDTRANNAGLCEPIVTACVGAEPGDATAECSGNSPIVCGPDRVTTQDGSPCGPETGCLDGACEPVLAECAGQQAGEAVCAADGTAAFICGENLASKEALQMCGAGLACGGGTCVRENCAGLAPTCGPTGDGDCCESPTVAGGSFYRGSNTSYPATISAFRLDKYEVTVGRFRRYVAATVAGWLPSAGSGKHTHLNGGSGLTATAGGYEPGWDASWNVDDATHRIYSGSNAGASWDSSLDCNTNATWTPSISESENLPIGCVNWYQAVAFCIWDGGFLPSEAEWEYAAAGGDAERTYPWGPTTPDCSYANFDNCNADAAAVVGSLSPKGDGLFEQSDLAGNMWEWVLDWYASPLSATCDDCTNATFTTNERGFRGGSFAQAAGVTSATYRSSIASPGTGYSDLGFRCARAP